MLNFDLSLSREIWIVRRDPIGIVFLYLMNTLTENPYQGKY
jgi:hypothetical protein